MLVLEGKQIYNMWQESGMGSVWDLKGPSDSLIPLNIELTHMFTIHVPRLRPIPGTTIWLQDIAFNLARHFVEFHIQSTDLRYKNSNF